ncbi:MAG: type II toxin-antitoxin system RelE/ParE family toxin [Reyranella sp.]|nr:type II toxin-antitoxin system RelE/ParE family toxin [Reyranella sp.]
MADSRNILDTLIEVARQRVATAYLARFSSALNRLRLFPQSGAPRPNLGTGIRIAVVHPYLLF